MAFLFSSGNESVLEISGPGPCCLRRAGGAPRLWIEEHMSFPPGLKFFFLFSLTRRKR